MKYVEPLAESERVTLEEVIKNHGVAGVRARAHAVLLSDRKFKLNEIVRIFNVDRDRVSHWLSAGETYGIMGLYDEARSGDRLS